MIPLNRTVTDRSTRKQDFNMSETNEKQTGFLDDLALRRLNRSIVEDYMSRKGEGRKTRYLLFT